MSAWAKYDIEPVYDFLYGEVSDDSGVTWTKVGTPIDGSSDWTQISYDLSAYKDQIVQFRFRYATDGGLHFAGPFLDDLALTVDSVTTIDNVESAVSAWTATGFTRMNGSTSKVVSNYYLAENRVYSGYDATLKTGPYNFGFANTRPDWVERFPYQNGLLVWYSDGACTDNNTIDHPGCGSALPVDARPAPIMLDGGVMLGNRRQPFDATFGQEATDRVVFHRNGVATVVPSHRAIPTFDDTNINRYWSALNPLGSTKVAGSGTKMTVDDTSRNGDEMTVNVSFKK